MEGCDGLAAAEGYVYLMLLFAALAVVSLAWGVSRRRAL